MGTVIINGKRYDSISGLPIGQTDIEPVASVISDAANQTESPTKTTAKAAHKKHQNRQQRMAEAISQEFADEDRDPKREYKTDAGQKTSAEESRAEIPAWLSEFAELHAKFVNPADTGELSHEQVVASESTVSQPAWISNFVSGGEPIEIQPIGLEAVQRHTKSRKTHVSAPNYRRHSPAHSQTLNRRFVKKPNAEAATVVSAKRLSAPVATHPAVHHFNEEKIPVNIVSKRNTDSTKTVRNQQQKAADLPFAPVITRHAEKQLAENKVSEEKSVASDIKRALIAEQFDQPLDNKSRRRNEKRAAKLSKRRRFAMPSIVTAALAVLVLGGYFTYANMPDISVRIAANRAGIDTKAPYTPDGYSIDGPVAYAPGQITIIYKSNAGANGYSIVGQKGIDATTPDDSAYDTLNAGNTTVYRQGDQITWSSDGVSYTLNDNGYLSDDQIEHIAQSV